MSDVSPYSAPALPLAFYGSRLFMVKTAAICLGFSVFSGWLYENDRGNWLATVCEGAFCCLLALVAAGVVFRLLKKTLVFAFTDEGLSFGPKMPLVPWRNIAEAREVAVGKKAFVGVFLVDVEQYLAGFDQLGRGKMARAAAEYGLRNIGTPVVLAPEAVGSTNGEIITLLQAILADKKKLA